MRPTPIDPTCPLAQVRTRGAGPDSTLQEDGSPFPGHTQARRCLPLASATVGSGGCQQSGRPCDWKPGYAVPS